MRTKLIALGIVLWWAASSLGLSAQALPFPKVPRRVYFAPAPASYVHGNRFLARLPEHLFMAICAIQPVVRVDSPQKAQSVIRIAGRAGEEGLTVELLDGDRTVQSARFPGGGDVRLAAFVEKTAAAFARHLEFVEPRIEVMSRKKGGDANAEIIRRVRQNERFAHHFELSVFASGLLRTLPVSQQPTTSAHTAWDAAPLVISFTWYPHRSLGLVGSLWTYYGSGITFGFGNNPFETGKVRALFLLPGIGLTYHTLGRVTASFSADFNAGYLHLTNLLSQPIGTTPSTTFITFLGAGASRSVFYPLLRFATNIGVSVTPSFRIETGVTLNFTPLVFFYPKDPFPVQGNAFLFQYLTVGAVYEL